MIKLGLISYSPEFSASPAAAPERRFSPHSLQGDNKRYCTAQVRSQGREKKGKEVGEVWRAGKTGRGKHARGKQKRWEGVGYNGSDRERGITVWRPCDDETG